MSIPLCIVCLKSSALEYIDFDTPFESCPSDGDDTGLTYLDVFVFCTRLNVEIFEGIPQSFCHSCGLDLKVAYEFLKKAENASNVLREAVVQTKFEPENQDSPTIIEVLNGDFETTVIDEEVEKKFDSNVLDLDKKIACDKCDSFFFQDDLNLHNCNEHTPIAHGEDDELEAEMLEDDEEILSNSLINEIGEQQNSIDIEKTTIENTHEVGQERNASEEEDLELTEDEQRIEMLEDDSADEISKTEDQTIKNPETLYKRCEICNRVTTTKGYEKHMSTHKGQKSFPCSECRKSFYSKRSLQIHFRGCHQSKVMSSCKICEALVSFKTMKTHIQEQHTRLVSCEKCDFQCEELKMREHIRKNHSDSKNFLCNICSQTFSTLGILNVHLKKHDDTRENYKSDACEICGKQFSTKHYLRAHMNVHKDDRQLFQCRICDKMYVSKTGLDNHEKLHKGHTKKCVFCSKEFARQYELNVHMRFHTRDYPFECDICEKKFAIKGHLRTHMWRHQGLKLQCEDCGKLFTSTKALQEHSFTHSEMPFPCPHCPKAYPSKQKFKVHLKTAHFLELPNDELQKLSKNPKPKQLIRRKVTLVQADTVMKEIVI